MCASMRPPPPLRMGDISPSSLYLPVPFGHGSGVPFCCATKRVCPMSDTIVGRNESQRHQKIWSRGAEVGSRLPNSELISQSKGKY